MLDELIYLPFLAAFLFVFAVTFGLLTIAKIMPKKQINAVIAIAIAAMTAMYEPFVTSLQAYMPIFAIILVILFMIIFVKKVLVGDKKDKDALPIIVSLGLLLIVLGVTWNSIAAFLPMDVDPRNALWGIGIIIILYIFYAVYKHPTPKQ